MRKKGRLSKAAARFITDNAESMTVDQIATSLERDPTAISTFIKRKLKLGLSDEEEASYTLEDRPYWKELKMQFTDEELESRGLGTHEIRTWVTLAGVAKDLKATPLFYEPIPAWATGCGLLCYD